MKYQYCILDFGGSNPYKDNFYKRLKEKLDFSQLSNGQYVITNNIDYIDIGKSPSVGLYWADGKKHDTANVIKKLQSSNVPIIPIVEKLNNASNLLPDSIKEINAAELGANDTTNKIEVITNQVLNFLGLLYKQRNVFISYRRAETEEAAKQIHIELVNNGYNAFLDMCDIQIGDDFQGVLKQRLSDSSVLLLLESNTFFKSHWTQEEYITANNLMVEILDVKWPGVVTPRQFNFYDSIHLSQDAVNPDGKLKNEILQHIVKTVNSLSSRYYEARRQAIVGNFMNEVKALGHNAFQKADGSISIEGLNGIVIPLIGVPQSWDYYKAATKAAEDNLFLLYDNQCILDSWLNHLKWIENKANIQPIYVNDNSQWISKNL